LLRSVAEQTHPDIEHVIIDGSSRDNTLALVSQYGAHVAKVVSERDSGIYDALNKGFKLSTGDLVGILHSDDFFHDSSVLECVARAFEDPSIDYVYGDIQMINSAGCLKRYWKGGPLLNGKISATQIPHPALFISRKMVEKIDPPFDSTYRIAADLKQQLILANILHAKGAYISLPLVKMRIGGASTANFMSYYKGWKESWRAWNEVHGAGGVYYVIKKVFSKLKSIKV
jgi:glycosyltransferase